MIRIAISILIAAPFVVSAQSTPPSCATASMTGTYYLTLTGRNVSSSTALNASYEAVGTATFDGMGNVTFSLIANTNLTAGSPQNLSGIYSLPTNCLGTLTITTGDSANYTLIAWNQGKNFTITGQDATYVLTGTGGPQPASSCITSILSGSYVFSGNGYTISSGSGGVASITGVNSVSGLLQFDGRGNIAGNWTTITNGTSTPDTVTGNYSVSSSCQATAVVTDPAKASWTLSLTMTSADGANFTVDAASLQGEFSAAAHNTFTNPGLAVANAASGVGAGTPPGSLFALYGQSLSPSSSSATKVPLPGTLAGTSVTVNGETAPLFYVSSGQINAQMPWDTQPGLASVVVTNTSGQSNTVAVPVPATAVPGVFPQYPGNQAVVANPDNSLNTAINPAHVGDVLVAYFTGGGPVTPIGPLLTGQFSPNGISPVNPPNYSVTVAGIQATVNYVGLTGSLVGIYQANFVVPKVAAGQRNLVITIDGKASTVTTISVAD